MNLKSSILILDFGGQYTQLICRRIRELGVYCEIRPYQSPIDEIIQNKPNGLILSGGPESVFLEDSPKPDSKILELGIPILGICYGMQWLHYNFGGSFLSLPGGEYGSVSVQVHPESILLDGIGLSPKVWMSHGDSLDPASIGMAGKIVARTKKCVAAVEWADARAYGVQFHPEVTHCEGGYQILENFVTRICLCQKNWSVRGYIQEIKKSLSEEIGTAEVLSFVSGGVDSTFVTVLLSSIPGVKVHAVYIEALMRKNETEDVLNLLRESGVDKLKVIRAKERFLQVLEGLSDPEAKRKAVGELFGRLQQEACLELGLDPNNTLLAQGTLYTDLIESGKGVGNSAHVIKSHHNVGCEFIEKLKSRGQVVEPAKAIFKDEVRKAAAEIGMPSEVVYRQPFPGPGMAIRIVSSDPDWIDADFSRQNRNLDQFCQHYGFRGGLLPVKTVGVQGDQRTYRFAAVLRGPRDWNSLSQLANLIPSEFECVNRVTFDPWEKGVGLLDQEINLQSYSFLDVFECVPTVRVDQYHFELLQDIDAYGRNYLREQGFANKISQTIFVLIGADLNHTGHPSVVIRAVSTEDFMTVKPVKLQWNQELITDSIGEISWECLIELRNEILDQFPIDSVLYDLSEKPPATTCWE